MKPTKYKEINALLLELTLRAQSILENNLIGAYIGGSIATNSFDFETSDIDYYVITTDLLSEDKVLRLEKMHKQLYSSKLPYAKKIEASYIPKQVFLNFDPNGTRPYFNEGQFYLGQYGNNYLIELHVLREKGITLIGQPIKSLIKKISNKDLILAIQKNLHEYWKITLNDSSKFARSDYQVFAILTMCRTLYSLETGRITSKIEAGQWAMQCLGAQWRYLIEQALAWKPGQNIDQSEETQSFIKYTLMKIHTPMALKS